MQNESSTTIAATITELEKRIEGLKLEKIEAERKEKQYQLLTGLDMFTQQQVKAMPDFELSDKCRTTSLSDFFSLLDKGLDIGVVFPLELCGKSVAQVLYVLDYIADEKKLDGLEISDSGL